MRSWPHLLAWSQRPACKRLARLAFGHIPSRCGPLRSLARCFTLRFHLARSVSPRYLVARHQPHFQYSYRSAGSQLSLPGGQRSLWTTTVSFRGGVFSGTFSACSLFHFHSGSPLRFALAESSALTRRSRSLPSVAGWRKSAPPLSSDVGRHLRSEYPAKICTPKQGDEI